MAGQETHQRNLHRKETMGVLQQQTLAVVAEVHLR
jgi:hypothetical protein